MILYVNGDSHSAAAEAVNTYCFAEDDSDQAIQKLGRRPHPDNLNVSYGKILADILSADLINDAESASSNQRILRTTKDYLKNNRPDLLIIGWSTWEREEWFFDKVYWQVNAGGVGHDWPEEIKKKYKKWICDLDYNLSEKHMHQEIYDLHVLLKEIKVPHIFFTCYKSFNAKSYAKQTWDNDYVSPYDDSKTYYNWLIGKGFKTIHQDSYHFGPDAHRAWAEFLYQNYVQRLLTR